MPRLLASTPQNLVSTFSQVYVTQLSDAIGSGEVQRETQSLMPSYHPELDNVQVCLVKSVMGARVSPDVATKDILRHMKAAVLVGLRERNGLDFCW